MFAITPYFVRSRLVLGLLAGGVFGVLGAGWATIPYHDPPPLAVEVAPAPAVEDVEADIDHSDVLDDDDDEALVTLALTVTQSTPGCAYYSAFDVEPVQVSSTSEREELTRVFDFIDGCTWRSREHLSRLGDGTWAYSYEEAPISCKRGHVAASSCTRSGIASPIEED